MLPLALGGPERRQIEVAVVALRDFLGAGAVGAFDRPSECRRSRRQDQESDAALLADLLKGRREFATAIDLDRPEGKGQTAWPGVQEPRGGSPGGLRVRFKDIPVGAHLAGREWLEAHAGQRPPVERIELDEVARLGDGIGAGLADGVGPGAATG